MIEIFLIVAFTKKIVVTDVAVILETPVTYRNESLEIIQPVLLLSCLKGMLGN